MQPTNPAIIVPTCPNCGNPCGPDRCWSCYSKEHAREAHRIARIARHSQALARACRDCGMHEVTFVEGADQCVVCHVVENWDTISARYPLPVNQYAMPWTCSYCGAHGLPDEHICSVDAGDLADIEGERLEALAAD